MKKVIIYFSVMAASCMLGSCSDLAFGDAFLEKAPGVTFTGDGESHALRNDGPEPLEFLALVLNLPAQA